MKRIQRRVQSVLKLSALALLCLSFSSTHAVFLDAERVANAEHRSAKLRWFNIEGAPDWQSGVQPASGRPGQPHTLTLKAGQETVLRVESPGQLRIRAESSEAGLDHLEFGISDGSGVFRALETESLQRGKDLLLQPDQPSNAVYRIRNHGKQPEPVVFSAFRAVFQSIPGGASTQWALAAQGRQSKISLQDGGPSDAFFRRGVGSPAIFDSGAEQWESARRFELRLRMDLANPQFAEASQVVVDVALDGQPWREFLLNSAAERNQLVYVDGAPALTGRQEKIHFRIPKAAKQITITSSVPAFMQLNADLEPAYLWSGNAPAEASTDTEQDIPLVSSNRSLPAWPQLTDRADAADTTEWVERLFRFGRDNRYRETGMAAIAGMREATTARPDIPALAHALQRLTTTTSFWRGLNPQVSKGTLETRAVRIVVPAQQDEEDSGRGFWAHPSQLAGELESTLEGSFSKAASGAELDYRLEPRLQPSSLLLAMPSGQHGRFRMQFDEAEPFDVEAVARFFPDERLNDFSGSQATALLAAGVDAEVPIAVNSVYASRYDERPAVAVRTAHIQLPANVRRVRVFPVPAESGSAEVALWVRTSRTAELDESSYRHFLDAAGSVAEVAQLFSEALSETLRCDADVNADPTACWPDGKYSTGYAPVPGPEHAARQLRNEWVPLLRLLRSRLLLFRGDLSVSMSAATKRYSSDRGSIARARQHMRSSRWLPALEEWSLVATSGTTARFVQGKIGQVQALRKLGETRAADQMLKQFALQAGAPALRQKAIRMLEEQYQREGEARALTGLYVAALLDGITKAEVGDLIRALLGEGFDAMAIRAQLASSAHSGGDDLYAALVRERWMLSLEQLLVKEAPPVQTHWSRLMHVAQGNYGPASSPLAEGEAGTRGWDAALSAGEAIRQRLQSKDADIRLDAVHAWKQWWEEHPGPRHFVSAGSRIRSSAGATTVMVPERNLSFVSWRAKPETPVMLSVTGPTRLRVAVRPVHARNESGAYAAMGGHIHFSLDGVERRFAYAGNRPSASLVMLSEAELAGAEVVREVDIPSGTHTARIWPGAGIALVRVEREQPALPLNVLPQPDPMRVAWIVHHGWPQRLPDSEPESLPPPFSVLPEPFRAALHGLLRANSNHQSWVEIAGEAGEPDVRLIAVTPDTWKGRSLPAWPVIRAWLDGSEQPGRQAEMAARFSASGNASIGAVSLLSADRPDAIGPMLNTGLSTGRFIGSSKVVAVEKQMISPSSPVDRDRERLIQRLQNGRSIDRGLLAELSLAAQRYPLDEDIQALLSMARDQGTAWRPVTSVQQSAGVRRLPIRGWSPETPALRVRRALMGNRLPEGEILGGAQALTLVMHNLGPTRVRITLRQIEMESEDQEPVGVGLYVDHHRVSSLNIRNQGVTQRTLEIGEGDHEIRVEAKSPVSGRYLHLLIEEYDAQKQRWVAVAPERSRTYQVATREEPVVFSTTGPAWIRIDEYRDGVVAPKYRYVPKSGTKLVLAARKPNDTAFYRIFEYLPEPRPVRLKPLDDAPRQIADASIAPGEVVRLVRQPVFHDPLPLGRQEDGTLSVYSKYALRRSTDADGIGGEERDHARDLGVQYRLREKGKSHNTYYFGEAFLREPDSGDLLLGLKSRFDRYPTGSPWAWGGQAALYLQDLDRVDEPAWGGQVKGYVSHQHSFTPKTHQTITLQPFLRGLGLSEGEARRSAPDPQLYSRYKRDHRYGTSLAWSGRHDLFADTRLRARSSMQTNEDFDVLAPDRVDATLGVEQKLGAFDLGIDFRSRYFFNDADRAKGLTRNRYSLFGDWSHWSHAGNRLNLRLEAAHDVEPGLWTANATVSWHFGAGREYTDFRPGEIQFRNLRELEIPETWNPSIDE